MGEVVPFMSVAEAFEHKVASLLREKFPEGWVGYDVFVGEEQTDVLAVLSQGIFAIECKAYTGKVFGDANGPWKAVKEGRERVIEPRGRNPYRQALTKAFAVSNFLQVTLDANPHLRVGEKPWIHACAVFPEEADLCRRQLHECFEQWLDSVEERVKEPKPTLDQLTRAVWELRQELTGSLIEALVEQRYQREQEQLSAPCPQCGRSVAARGVVSRTLETLVGEIELGRPYFYCVSCGQGFAPLDTTLGLAPGRKQFDVQQAAVKLANAPVQGSPPKGWGLRI